MSLKMKFGGVLLAPALLVLSGCGGAPRIADPAASAGVERCGSETRACWQVKSTTASEEYPAEAATAVGDRHDSGEQATGAH